MLLVSHLRNLCPKAQIFVPKILSKGFIVWGFIIRSKIHYEFICLIAEFLFRNSLPLEAVASSSETGFP